MTGCGCGKFIHKVAGVSFFKPRVIIVPSRHYGGRGAVIDAGIQAGARKVYLIEEPGGRSHRRWHRHHQPDGHMVVDIGSGTADIAVISPVRRGGERPTRSPATS